MNTQSRLFRIGGTAIAAVLVLAAAYFAVVQITIRSAEARFEEWAAELRAEGYDVQFGTLAASGRPGAVALDFADLEIGRPSDPLNWRWRVPAMRVDAGWGGSPVAINFAGAQSLAYQDQGTTRTLSLGAERLRVSFVPGEQGGRAGLEATRLVFGPPGEQPSFTAGRLQVQVALGPGPGMIPDHTAFTIQADAVVVPAQRRGPLGDAIQAIELGGSFYRPVLSAETVAGAFGAWRDDRGYFDLTNLRLLWGTLNSRGEGRITLDGAFRPTGQIRALLRRHMNMVDALQAGGLIDEQEMANVGALLLFLKNHSGDEVAVPVVIAEGELRVGPVTLGSVQPLLPAP